MNRRAALHEMREDVSKERGRQVPPRDLTQSEYWWAKAKEIIPRGTQTLSKGPDQFVDGVTPKYLDHGQGCHVWDVDGNEYIDYPMALGPILLGYNYPPVVEAVTREIRKGTTFTLMSPLEVRLAELLVEVIPCAEMVRFGKNGADATMAAIRIARAYTGRDHVAFCGYHGCHDWYAITTSLNRGIPRFNAGLVHPFEYNRPETLEALLSLYPDKIGAVIMEVPAEEPRDNFLERVIEIAHKHGALFILDETCTGFRWSLGGAQEYYGVVPDLGCFGKGMANGFSISAIVGKKEFMKELDEIFFSMTFSGETIGLAASIATVSEIRKKGVVDCIWKQGRKLRDGLYKIKEELKVNVEIIGHPPRSGFLFRDASGNESLEIKSLFLQETHKRGILFGGPVYLSFSHTDDDIERTLDASFEAMRVVKDAADEGSVDRFMEGKKIGTVYRSRR
ncbi:MAG TPA: aminotransferase class III-fold pyridoxal phosphate-dependent enzyme [Syntrophorhabdales bacterium]|nr:aminotransferase class III-fold pyridoxal phosphate-dependent enzyme [Syntrophorhabdales bacterium]